MTRVFILGAAGYIGGSVLTALKKEHPSANYTVLVRSPSDVQALETVASSVVVGSFTEYDKVTSLVAEADIIINAADCDDVALADAIIAGLRRKKDKGHGVGTLIHTSGAAVFLDDVKDGTCPPDRKIANDGNEEEIRSINPEKPHAPVDIRILKAGEEGVANTYIICPTAVYGIGSGPCHKPSVYYKHTIAIISAKGQISVIGEGKNLVGMVHIDDLVAIYSLIFNKALKDGSKLLATSPYARYYIITNQDISQIEFQTWVAHALHKLGRIGSLSVNRLAFEEAGPLAKFFAANMAPKGTRATSEFGWIPKAQLLDASVVEQDVKATLAYQKN